MILFVKWPVAQIPVLTGYFEYRGPAAYKQPVGCGLYTSGAILDNSMMQIGQKCKTVNTLPGRGMV